MGVVFMKKMIYYYNYSLEVDEYTDSLTTTKGNHNETHTFDMCEFLRLYHNGLEVTELSTQQVVFVDRILEKYLEGNLND